MLICSCGRSPKYLHQIGFIGSDESFSPSLFKMCDSLKVFQYYNSFPAGGYKFSKKKLKKRIESLLTDLPLPNGYLISRFVINCQGRAGRFTVNQYDLNLNEVGKNKLFAKRVTEVLLSDTLQWQPVVMGGMPRDTYMYVMLKIDHGQLQAILP
jgi:hypothetical protein